MSAAMRHRGFAGAAMMPCAAEIEAEIARQVAARGAGKTICPSEVARALAGEWRVLMPAVRDVAAEMAQRGDLRVTQKGAVVDARRAKGPIRLGVPG